VYGNCGLKSKPFRKAFKTAADREKWLDKNAEDITVLGFSDPITPKVKLPDFMKRHAEAQDRGIFGL
jgi:hypothetical protein